MPKCACDGSVHKTSSQSSRRTRRAAPAEDRAEPKKRRAQAEKQTPTEVGQDKDKMADQRKNDTDAVEEVKPPSQEGTISARANHNEFWPCFGKAIPAGPKSVTFE